MNMIKNISKVCAAYIIYYDGFKKIKWINT